MTNSQIPHVIDIQARLVVAGTYRVIGVARMIGIVDSAELFPCRFVGIHGYAGERRHVNVGERVP